MAVANGCSLLLMYRSTVTAADVPDIITDVYNLNVKVVQELTSYDDHNFYVQDVSVVSDNTTHGYVLKILNSLDSQNPDIIELQTQIMLHMKNVGYPTPGVIPCKDGQLLKLMSLPARKNQNGTESTSNFIVRLFTFLPGLPLDHVKLTLNICFQIGWFAGRMDIVLKDFCLVDKPQVGKMKRKWNMSEIPNLRSKVHSVTSSEMKSVVIEVIEQFETQILTCQHMFSKGLIHGDFNECNIIVSENSHFPIEEQYSSPANSFTSMATKCQDEGKGYNISGIIDFGDTTYSLYIFEIAIAMTYVMLNQHNLSPTAAAGHVLAGYLSHITVSQIELQHLRLCICARLVQSIVMGYFTFSEDPSNRYILTHASRAWPLLNTLWQMSDSTLLQLLNVPNHLS
uniref:Hydroxylysine kinase n=2 Tax=Biomphalaria glabrata TaxID=6526 RepID=A0A2C9KE41_BIOGL